MILSDWQSFSVGVFVLMSSLYIFYWYSLLIFFIKLSKLSPNLWNIYENNK